MNDVPDTDLISAYLDGETTAEEQVRVEQMLAASPAARQLLEELRALGTTLQGLPEQKLDEDLSGRVLEVAERRMLSPEKLPDNQSGDAVGLKPSAGRAAETMRLETSGSDWQGSLWRGMFSKRALIWSAVVITTAIIIFFTSPAPKNPQRDFAKLDEAENKSTAPPAIPGGERSKRSLSGERWEAARPTPTPADRAKPANSESREADGKADRATEFDDALAPHDNRRWPKKLAELKEQPNVADGAALQDRIDDKNRGAVSATDTVRESQAKDAAAQPMVPDSGAAFEEKAAVAKSNDTPRPANSVAESGPPSAAPMAPAAPSPVPIPLTLPKAPAPSAPPAGAMASRRSASNPSQPDPSKLGWREGTGTLPALAKPGESVSPKSDESAARLHSKLGSERGAGQDAHIESNLAAKRGDKEQSMNSVNSLQSDTKSFALGAVEPGKRPIVQAATTVIRLSVSPPAVETKVFEKLLEQHGLVGNKNLADAPQNGSVNYSNWYRDNGSQVDQGSQGGRQMPPVAENGPRTLAKKAESPEQENAKAVQQQALQSAYAVRDYSATKPTSRPGSKPMIYQCDVSPEQLSVILKQIKDRSDSFSALEIEGLTSNPLVSGGTSSLNYSYGANPAIAGGAALGGGMGGMGGAPGAWGYHSGEPAQAQTAGQSKPASEAATQYAAPAAAKQQATQPSAKQHVVFVLNVVDRAAPTAGPASAAQPPAVPAKP